MWKDAHLEEKTPFLEREKHEREQYKSYLIEWKKQREIAKQDEEVTASTPFDPFGIDDANNGIFRISVICNDRYNDIGSAPEFNRGYDNHNPHIRAQHNYNDEDRYSQSLHPSHTMWRDQ